MRGTWTGNEYMRPSERCRTRSLWLGVVCCALLALLSVVSPAGAATLKVEEFLLNYTTQGPDYVEGTIQFDIMLNELVGSDSYDLFSSQVSLIHSGDSATFVFDTATTMDTDSIDSYWLADFPVRYPTSGSNVDRFWFQDAISFVYGVTPTLEHVFVRYAFDFSATADQFGDYTIEGVDDQRSIVNEFMGDFQQYPNTLIPMTFGITPEPSTALLLSVAGLTLRRRR